MRIQWAIPCRYAEVRDGQLTVAGGGADVLRPRELPVTLTLHLALSIQVPEHELGRDEEILVRALDPDMREMELDSLRVRLTDYPGRPPAREPSVMAAVPVEVDVRSRGMYTLNLRLQHRITPVSLFVLEP